MSITAPNRCNLAARVTTPSPHGTSTLETRQGEKKKTMSLQPQQLQGWNFLNVKFAHEIEDTQRKGGGFDELRETVLESKYRAPHYSLHLAYLTSAPSISSLPRSHFCPSRRRYPPLSSSISFPRACVCVSPVIWSHKAITEHKQAAHHPSFHFGWI